MVGGVLCASLSVFHREEGELYAPQRPSLLRVYASLCLPEGLCLPICLPEGVTGVYASLRV